MVAKLEEMKCPSESTESVTSRLLFFFFLDVWQSTLALFPLSLPRLVWLNFCLPFSGPCSQDFLAFSSRWWIVIPLTSLDIYDSLVKYLILIASKEFISLQIHIDKSFRWTFVFDHKMVVKRKKKKKYNKQSITVSLNKYRSLDCALFCYKALRKRLEHERSVGRNTRRSRVFLPTSWVK